MKATASVTLELTGPESRAIYALLNISSNALKELGISGFHQGLILEMHNKIQDVVPDGGDD